MTFAEYRQYDALGLAELVRKGDVTPSELLELAIQRAEMVNPQLNAIIEPLYERARKNLAALPPDQVFSGVPFLLKDLSLELKSAPFREGSKSQLSYQSTVTSYLVEQLEEAGLQLIGKTNTPEFGLTPFTEPSATGVTRNPWDTGRTAGGSSGGSAAAIAAGIVPLATASDGGGSIRIPASCCGLFGLKSSRGRISQGPQSGGGWEGAVVEGCNSRSVRDSAAYLDTFGQPLPGELSYAPPPERPYSEEIMRKPDRLRIGFSTQHTLGHEIDTDCRAAVQETAQLLTELGHEVEEVPLPYRAEDLTEVFIQMIFGQVNAKLRSVGERRGRPIRRGDVEDNTYALYLLGQAYTAGDYAYYRTKWNQIARRQANFHQTYDLLLTSTVAKAPFKIGALQPTAAEKRLISLVTRFHLKQVLKANVIQLAEKIYEYIPYTALANMTGQPSMSVPLHWTAQGLPVGVMFTAPLYREDILFRMAAQLAEARPWMQKMAMV